MSGWIQAAMQQNTMSLLLTALKNGVRNIQAAAYNGAGMVD